MRPQRLEIKTLCYTLGLCLSVFSCFGSHESIETQVEVLIERGDATAALDLLKDKLNRETDRKQKIKLHFLIADLLFKNQKSYKESLGHFEKIVLLSRNDQDRIKAQKAIVEIQLDHLGNTKEAVVELNKLLEMNLKTKEKIELMLKLAKTQFSVGNFAQAEADLKDFEKLKSTDPDLDFQGKLLRANLYTAKGKPQEALDLLKSLLTQSPNLARKYNVIMSVSLLLEEQGRFQEAIDFLELNRKVADDGAYLSLKIERLRQRIQNMPGNSGVKK